MATNTESQRRRPVSNSPRIEDSSDEAFAAAFEERFPAAEVEAMNAIAEAGDHGARMAAYEFPRDPWTEELDAHLALLQEQHKKRVAQEEGGLFYERTSDVHFRVRDPKAPPQWTPPPRYVPIRQELPPSFRPGATGGLQSPPMTNHPPAPTLNIQPPLYHGQGERSKDIFAAHAAQRAEEQRKKQARAARTTGINFGTGTPSLPPRRQSP